MGNLSNYDVDNWSADGAGGFDPMPDGEYPAICLTCIEKETKSGGKMFAADFQIIGEHFAGRRVFENFNVRNANPVAENIGRAEFKAFILAVGKPKIQDSAELCNVPVMLRLGRETRKDNGELVNRIKKIRALGGDTPNGKPAVQAHAVAHPPASASASMPWK